MGGELQRLRMAVADKDSHIRSLEDRLAQCQDSLRDTRAQVQHCCAGFSCMPVVGCAHTAPIPLAWSNYEHYQDNIHNHSMFLPAVESHLAEPVLAQN